MKNPERDHTWFFDTAPHPRDASLYEDQVLGTIAAMETMRHKQRIENRFKVETREMRTDALPSQKTYKAKYAASYDTEDAEKRLKNATKRHS